MTMLRCLPLSLLRPLSWQTRHLSSQSSSSTSTFEQLKSAWEENSGQVELSALKARVTEASDRFDTAVRKVEAQRVVVEEAQKSYDELQRQHASLLMRREHWGSAEAQSFVDITGKEVASRQALAEARQTLRDHEHEASRSQLAYMDTMRRRYHEEQIWQEKWRVLGTYGTWTLIGLNSIVFLGGQYFNRQREQTRLASLQEFMEGKLNTISAMQEEQLREQKSPSAVAGRSSEGSTTASSSSIEEAEEEDSPVGLEVAVVEDDPESRSKTATTRQSDPATLEYWQALFDDFKSGRKEVTLAEVDVPSAVVGAAISATGFLIILWLSDRR